MEIRRFRRALNASISSTMHRVFGNNGMCVEHETLVHAGPFWRGGKINCSFPRHRKRPRSKDRVGSTIKLDTESLPFAGLRCVEDEIDISEELIESGSRLIESEIFVRQEKKFQKIRIFSVNRRVHIFQDAFQLRRKIVGSFFDRAKGKKRFLSSQRLLRGNNWKTSGAAK